MKRKRIELSHREWSRIAHALASYAHTEYNCAGTYCKKEIELSNLIANKIGIESPAGRLEIP